ncbi:glycosyl hydrolase 2 galactose-binding domain-containing protein [Longispora urticae]
MRRTLLVLLVLAGVLTAARAEPVARRAPGPEHLAVGGPARTGVLTGYQIRSSALVPVGGSEVSRTGFDTAGWAPVPARSTVFGGLLGTGAYPDPFHSTAMAAVDPAAFAVPWWFRADFPVAPDAGEHTSVEFSGVLSRAEVWVNGTRVAGADTVVGMYPTYEFDLSALVRPGVNTLAFLVHPNDPARDLTTGWIDWNPAPPDRNTGLVGDVTIRQSGPVALRGARVLTRLELPGRDHADLTAKVEARNNSDRPVLAALTGYAGPVPLNATVALAPRETRTVTFERATVVQPRVWWPAGMGEQHRYELLVDATVAGRYSDGARDRFGVRGVTTRVEDDIRHYAINGRPLVIRGAGWSPDLFLRDDPARLAQQFAAALDLGLNTLRLEGRLGNDDLYEEADRVGLLLLPGWECCGRWEDPDSWTAEDHAVARASMAGVAARLRNHPSVLSFLIGSDEAPPERVAADYLAALGAADWPTPVLSSASGAESPGTGPPGLRMTGPYDWVPPGYWYAKRDGGAWGFNAETSAGAALPSMDTLRAMSTREELDRLWREPDAPVYRAGTQGFADLRIFHAALAGRYGPPTGLEDYVGKAHLAQFEAVRAQFEAYARNSADEERPATGQIYWNLTAAWPSVHWQLFDSSLDPTAGYHAAKRAHEPLHVQYSYDDRSVVLVRRGRDLSGLTVRAELFGLDGRRLDGEEYTDVTAEGGNRGGTVGVTRLGTVAAPDEPTYLLRLVATDAKGRERSRNVYWLSAAPDVLDYPATSYITTPTSSYADLTGLAGMARAEVAAAYSSESRSNGDTVTTVTLSNTSQVPALQVGARVLGAGGRSVLPVRWSDNLVCLWPGESVTLRATHRAPGAVTVRVEGWNVTSGAAAPGPAPAPGRDPGQGRPHGR